MSQNTDPGHVPPLSAAERFSIRWLTLCERFGLDPEMTGPYDFTVNPEKF